MHKINIKTEAVSTYMAKPYWNHWHASCMLSFKPSFYNLVNHNQHSAIADSHTFQFTTAHALRFSVSTSCILATDLNTENITLNHYEVFLPFFFNHVGLPTLQNSTEFSNSICPVQSSKWTLIT